MARGRTAKPTALKALQGNAGHRSDDRGNEPSPTPGAPEMPDWLREVGDVAVRKYYEVCGQMAQVAGWLTKADGDTLAMYCSAWERIVDAERQIPALRRKLAKERRSKERGRLLNEINSLIGQRKQAGKEQKTYSDALGLSPASRTRIRVNPGQAELPLGDTTSPFARAQSLAHGA